MPRMLRKVRRGVQGGCTLQQVPSGLGPSVQAPPACLGRRHSQRSPSFTGLHSLAPPHWPSPFGPCQHDLPHLPPRPQQ